MSALKDQELLQAEFTTLYPATQSARSRILAQWAVIGAAGLILVNQAHSYFSGQDEQMPLAQQTGPMNPNAVRQPVDLQPTVELPATTEPVKEAVSSEISIAWLPDTVAQWRGQILTAAQTHGIDPEMIAIVMLVESCGNPKAQSRSGAVANMQVMPSTGAGIAAERGITGYTPDQLWIPETNIDFGAYYLAQQLRAFGQKDDTDWQQSVELAASAYNGGPGSVQRLLAGGSLPNETVRYRQWVGGMWRERKQSTSSTLDAWLAAGGQVLCTAAEAQMGLTP